MKKFFAIVMSMLMIACFMPSMAFAEQTTYDTLGDLASGKSITVNFSYQENVTTKGTSVTIDGKNDSVTKWVDAWVYQDTTIKNVTFENGATFNVGVDGVTLSLENCTFKACDQSKLTNEGHQSKTNSGGGMCLDVETRNHTGVTFNIKNCTSEGDGSDTTPAYGNKYDQNGNVEDAHKKRGYGIALNAIEGSCDDSPTLSIDGCVIEDTRGNAIQLHGTTGNVTIENSYIKSWGRNSGKFTWTSADNTSKEDDGNSTAIRGDMGTERTVIIENVYFGMDEDVTTRPNDREIKQVKMGSNKEDFAGNTDGERVAGTYSASSCEAKIGTTPYKKLSEAVTEAENEATITLLNDVTVSSALSVNKNVTIDGQGKYTIKAADNFSTGSSKEDNCVLYIAGDVTLKNVSVDGNDKCRVICCTSGKLTIDGTTVTKGKTASSYIGGVYMTGGSSFEMKSGSITQNSNAEDYQNNYIQYSKDLWIGSEATGIISGGTVGNAFVNANKYSKNEAGLTLTGGKIGNVYVEYDNSKKAQFIYTDGVVEKLYLAKDDKGNSIEMAPEKGNTYNGGISEDQVATVTLKYADSSTSDDVLTVPENSLVNLPTPTLSGYTFNGWYSEGTKIASPYTVTKDATLAASWSRIRSGSSSSSSTTTTTDTVTNTTEDKGADTSTSTGTTTVATTTATVKAETKTATDGTKTVAATVDTTTASKIVEKAVENKSEEVVIDAATAATTGTTAVTETAAGTTTEVALPEQTVKAIAEKTEAAVTIKSEAAEIKLDTEAVKAVAEQAGDLGTVNLVVETVAQNETKVEVDLKLVTSKGTVSDFKGGSVSVTVKLNTALAAKPVVCVYIDDFGTYHKVKGAKNADGTFTFETGHFSTYAVMAEDEADGVIAEQTKNVKDKVGDLSLKARSEKTEKGSIKVTLTVDGEAIKAIEDLGYTVKYKFYRSTEKSASYKAALEKTGKTYTNTTGKKGTKYYYKARVMVYDAQGELVAKSELKQCRYACRIR